MRVCYTSEGHSILPKAVAFARFIFCLGTTPLRLVPSVSMYHVHLLLNIGINRTFKQTAEVLCDLLKCRSCVEATLLRSVDTSDSSAVFPRQCFSIEQEQRHMASPCYFLSLLFTHSSSLEIQGHAANFHQVL